MSKIIDPRSDLVIGDCTHIPKILADSPSHDAVLAVLNKCILSASGWRTVFTASGNEEDFSGEILPEAAIVMGAMAWVFADGLSLLSQKSVADCQVAVGCDSRPTGEILTDIMVRVFLARGMAVRYLFITAAPEIMAYTRNCPDLTGFAYISASHNPIGHNGVKFGLKTGGVLNSSEISPLIQNLRAFLGDPQSVKKIRSLLLSVDPVKLTAVFNQVADFKRQSLREYATFTSLVISDKTNSLEAEQALSDLKAALQTRPIGIVADLNGSARTLTIDQDYLGNLGVKLLLVNGKPREIAHRIVPEGYSLYQCRDALEAAYATDSAYILGYVPDNDGDRGNFVYIDEDTGKANILEAQTVFALCCLSELAFLEASGKVTYDQSGKPSEKLAIAVNDPTSMRIDEIAEAFGVSVYRAEVGEANVVNLANDLRNQGYRVRILGEGSNGGNITYPAAVRDPLNSVASLLKLLTLRGGETTKGIFEVWCLRSGQPYRSNFGMADILRSLPAYTTTSAFEERAVLRIKSSDQARLKAAYEAIFLMDWQTKKTELQRRLGIVAWEELNNEGTRETSGMGEKFRSGKQTGGLKILFKDENGSRIAYLWMRGSGTEPVFRVSVDLKGDHPQNEAWLLDWQVSMIAKADSV